MAIQPVNFIQSNFSADRAGRVLTENTLLLQKSLARLSSGLRIISPGDDPAGVAQTAKFESVLTRINAAQTVVSNATSFAETQSGFLDDVQDALDRMSELAVLSQDSLTTSAQRSEYQTEFVELKAFISDIGSKNFNGISLFGTSSLRVVIDSDANQFTMQTTLYTSTGASGGLATAYASGTSIATTTAAATALTSVSTAITNLGLMQAKVGSAIARLDLTSDVLSAEEENLSTATSLIRDVDVATETTEYARLQLLVDSGTAMLTQSQLLPQSLLSLIEGL